MRFVITRVEISGFKSFQDFGLDLEPLLMLLGGNSAGKSNLFDALAVISRLAQVDVSRALQGGRGSIRDQFSHTSDGIADMMSFAIELLLSETDVPASLAQTRFRYEVAVGRRVLPSGIEELSVISEMLRPMASLDDRWIASHPEFASSLDTMPASPACTRERSPPLREAHGGRCRCHTGTSSHDPVTPRGRDARQGRGQGRLAEP
jgi:hypothetical protein